LTVIAAQIVGDRVIIAADSAITVEGCFKFVDTNSKIATAYDSVFACSGDPGAFTMFMRYLDDNPFNITEKKHLVDYFTDFYKWLEERGTTMLSSDGGTLNEFVVFTNGQLYHIHGLFIRMIADDVAIGSGGMVAKVAMQCGQSPISAVAVAIDVDPYCGGPIRVLTMNRLQSVIEDDQVIDLTTAKN
jgi:ATP-dependent protease HslVU (ClpYQ) peptidase subunit